jgi:hypothetical protein
MKKVYQTIVDKDKGNCLQAAIASLFEKELEEVPDFKSFNEGWYSKLSNFYVENGYPHPTPFHVQRKEYDLDFIKEILRYDNGINGYFEATVESQTFKDTTHSVVVDTELNIVHDPNPNQLALKLNPKDIVSVDTVKDDWYIDGGKFIIGKWKN